MAAQLGEARDRLRLRVQINGAVQGVGFRPFTYRLANELGLTGFVGNDARGVCIEVEGPAKALESFLRRLPVEQPRQATILGLEATWLVAAGHKRFIIQDSDEQGRKTAIVLPDIATCPECLAEVFSPSDRRYGYPFANCTNCGPRFSIIRALPYDRPNTTMQGFTMCPACRAEYDHPADRRFHAQPNACPVCGPRLELWTRSGESLAKGPAALARAAKSLQSGQILAVKGLGGFHLLADANNTSAIARLRAGKIRRDKPFALMARDLAQVRELCELSAQSEKLLAAPQAPIVLLRRLSAAPVGVGVAPSNPYLGIMLPYTPLHQLLLREVGFPVVATSGNLSDEPICTDEREALRRLGQIADLFLVHDRPIERHVDDSIMALFAGEGRVLRRARGCAPLPVLLAHPCRSVLAVGGQLKNTVALSVERQVFISQHIGDLGTPEALAAFERVIADFLRLYEAAPLAIAHDMHPDYLSTRWAQQAAALGRLPAHSPGIPDGVRLIPVQHHHAHMAACLTENGVRGRALGIIWDGTGYGLDGTIWGGEFLLGDTAGFQRVAHLRPYRLPGGEAAVREPARVALALLWELYGAEALERYDLAPVRAFGPGARGVLGQMLAKGINSPWTTSAGRLFDAVAALAALHQRVTFEGQAAMALEFVAGDAAEAYPLPVTGAAVLELDWRPLVESVLWDVQRGTATGDIAARFHNSLVEAIAGVAKRIGEPVVALSGGCFQNRRLVEHLVRRLREAGHQVLLHRVVPPNDGGISLGQVVVATTQLGDNADGGPGVL